MNLNTKPFNEMAIGKKRSELRLNDEKRQKILVGDTITFTNTTNPDETILVTVTHLNHYPTFADMFDGIAADYPDWKKEPFIQGMYQYYTPENEKQWGVLEIGIQLVPANHTS